MESIKKIQEDGTIAGCYGTGKPTPPNQCDTCSVHSDWTCRDIKVRPKE